MPQTDPTLTAPRSTPPDASIPVLRLGHSPDPDDAFMWYPLANFVGPDGSPYTPKIDTAGYQFEHVLEDIQSLNERSQRGELEITALSIHQYPFVADQYALTSCGSSMGEGYGPMVVARQQRDLADFLAPMSSPSESDASPDLSRPVLAIPGLRTTAWLAFQLLMRQRCPELGATRRINFKVLAFDQIIDAVVRGDVAAGLIIHEGQLVYEQYGLNCLVDLGQWWTGRHDLPLPLGGNAIRRDLGDAMPVICRVLRDSIDYALEHRDQAVRFALQWARGMESTLADRFVGMYVNRWTLDYGPAGRKAVALLLREGIGAGLIPDCGPVDFVTPAAASKKAPPRL